MATDLWVTFDLETSKVLPADANLDENRPLGISCAATLTRDGELKKWSAPSLADDWQLPRPAQMTSAQLADLADYLEDLAAKRYKIVTWNGLKFDFDILQEEIGSDHYTKILAEIALHCHIDMMFNLLCLKGYPCSLQKAAEGLGLEGKMVGMDGGQAPQMWQDGYESQNRVLEYVAQDALATADVFSLVQRFNEMRWISKSGKLMKASPTVGSFLETVDQANQWPLPNTSWMKEKGLTREDCLAWTVGKAGF